MTPSFGFVMLLLTFAFSGIMLGIYRLSDIATEAVLRQLDHD